MTLILETSVSDIHRCPGCGAPCAVDRDRIEAAENAGQSPQELKALLGRGRAKKGMFDGDLDNGELEIGQVSSLIQAVKPAAEVMTELVEGYSALTRGMEDPRFRWA